MTRLFYCFLLTVIDKNLDKCRSVVAAATENYDNGKDDDPGAVIVEEMAEAVVIHSMILRCTFAIFGRSLHLMLAEKKCYRKRIAENKKYGLSLGQAVCNVLVMREDFPFRRRAGASQDR